MPDKPSQKKPSPGDLGDAARDLAERFQSTVEMLHRTGQAGLGALGSGVPAVVDQWLNLLEATTAQTAVPITQLQALFDGIGAQRAQMKALQTQLATYDKQLSAMESALQPLLAWGQQWVRVQESVVGRVRDLTQPDR